MSERTRSFTSSRRTIFLFLRAVFRVALRLTYGGLFGPSKVPLFFLLRQLYDRHLKLSIDTYNCRSTLITVDRHLQLSIDTYNCRSTLTTVDRHLQLSIDTYNCRSTLITVDRHL